MAAMGDDMAADDDRVLDLSTTHARARTPPSVDFRSPCEPTSTNLTVLAERVLPFKKRRLRHRQTGDNAECRSLPIKMEAPDFISGGQFEHAVDAYGDGVYLIRGSATAVDNSDTDSVKDLTLKVAAMETRRSRSPEPVAAPSPRDSDEVKDAVMSSVTEPRDDETDWLLGRGVTTGPSWPDDRDNTNLNRKRPASHEGGECSSEVLGISEEEIKYIKQSDEDGDLPLHIAAVQEKVDMVLRFTYIMNKMNISLDQMNALKQTPLHLAVLTKNDIIVRHLLNAGASPNAPDRKGNTCCHLAVKENAAECLEVILRHSKERVDLDAQNYEGMTALHYAVKLGFLKGIQMLVEHGAEINIVDGKSGRTPLYMAFECNQSKSAGLLLSLGADVNVPTYSGCTLMQAVNSRGQKLLTDNNVNVQTRPRKMFSKCRRQKHFTSHTSPL